MAKTLTPEQMLGELTRAHNALTASGVDVFGENKAGTDLVLSATTARGTRTCESCNGRGTVEAITHNTTGRYDRRDRGNRGGRANSDSNWRHGGQGYRHSDEDNRRGDHTRSYDVRTFEVRGIGGGRGRASSSKNRRGRGEGRGGRRDAFSAQDATLFVAHASYDEELSSAASKTGVALMLDARAEYGERD